MILQEYLNSTKLLLGHLNKENLIIPNTFSLNHQWSNKNIADPTNNLHQKKVFCLKKIPIGILLDQQLFFILCSVRFAFSSIFLYFLCYIYFFSHLIIIHVKSCMYNMSFIKTCLSIVRDFSFRIYSFVSRLTSCNGYAFNWQLIGPVFESQFRLGCS